MFFCHTHIIPGIIFTRKSIELATNTIYSLRYSLRIRISFCSLKKEMFQKMRNTIDINGLKTRTGPNQYKNGHYFCMWESCTNHPQSIGQNCFVVHERCLYVVEQISNRQSLLANSPQMM